MDIKRADYTELRNFNTLIQNAVVLLRDALFFFTEEQDAFLWELVFVEHLRVSSLFNTEDDVTVAFLVVEVT